MPGLLPIIRTRDTREPTPATFQPALLVIILYTHFVVCAIAHEVKGSRDRFMFWRMRDELWTDKGG
ncbi:hypothetical protein SAMN05216315_1399 [Nitrosospira sp. Nsp18]|nr:hypothetical protein SAMN05216315_1399 [Nitrosospira sp. Nsp18]